MGGRAEPAGAAAEPAALAAALIAAINARDADALGELLGAGAEVVTGRTVHAGREAILAWASREYDHLTRAFAIDEYRTSDEAVLALGSVQYAWTEGGEVADSTPIALVIELDGEALRRLTVHDDTRAALVEFESR